MEKQKTNYFVVVEKLISDDDESLNGLKNVNVYVARDNSMNCVLELELENYENSKMAVVDAVIEEGLELSVEDFNVVFL